MNISKKISLYSDNKGSVVVLLLILLVVLMGFVAFSVDLAYQNLSRAKTALTNDLSALVGAVQKKMNKDDEDAKYTARLTALANSADVNSLSIDIPKNNPRAIVRVSQQLPSNAWFSKVLGFDSQRISTQESAAAVDLQSSDNSVPLHVIVMVDVSTWAMEAHWYRSIWGSFVDEKKFLNKLVESFNENDTLTLITYGSLARIIFKNLQMDISGKAMAIDIFSKLGPGYYGNARYYHNEIHKDSLGEFASALTAAENVLSNNHPDRREALINLSYLIQNDYTSATKSAMLDLINSGLPYAEQNWDSRSIDLSDGSWFWYDSSDMDSFASNCGLEIKNVEKPSLPSSLRKYTYLEKSIAQKFNIPDSPTEFDVNLEYQYRLVKNLQENRDLRLYTVSLWPRNTMLIVPVIVIPQGLTLMPFLIDYATGLAEDDSFVNGSDPIKFKCTDPGRKEKKGKYYPNVKDISETVTSLITHAKHAPFSGASSTPYTKATLVNQIE